MFRSSQKKKERAQRHDGAGGVAIEWDSDNDVCPPGISSQMMTLRAMVRSASVFVVPPYQRAYAWGESQVDKLLDDTLTFCAEDRPSFFLGTCVRQRDEPGVFKVIDGHQRMMTLTLILAYLRDACGDVATAERLQELIAPKGRKTARLLVRRADQDLVRHCVQAPGRLNLLAEQAKSAAQRRLRDAAAVIIETLSQLTPDALINYAHFLVRRVTFNVIEAENDVSAATLFRVLNQRGLRLSESALVKSQLLVRANIPDSEADDLSDRWDKREDELGEDNFEALLKLTPMIIAPDPNRREGDLSLFYMHEFSPSQCAQFVRDSIWKYIDLHQWFTPSEIDRAPANDRVKRVLKLLLLYRDRAHWMAPAMDYLSRAEHTLDAPATLRFLEGLERLCFARAMGVIRDRNHHSRFAKVTAARGKESALFAPGVLGLNPSEGPLLIKKINEPCNQDRRRILALRANAAIPNGEVVLDGHTEATIEHIFPLSDSAHWLTKFPRKETRNDLKDLLGNFTIVTGTQNREADQKTYAQKLAIYFDPKYKIRAMTAMLREHKQFADWNEVALMYRHELLVDVLCRDLKLTSGPN
jgi:hypothetical protein